MKLEAVIFDKDGTLFDFQATWGAWTNTVLDRFCGTDAALKQAVADDLDYDLDRLEIRPTSLVVAGTPMQIAEHVARHFPEMTPRQIFEHLNALAKVSTQVPVTELSQMCQLLRDQNLKLAVMTNDAEAPARANLDSVGALELFDFVIGSDSGYGAKPAAAPLLALAEKMGVSPDACAMVGDSTHDLHAGQAAGMQRVAVLTGLASQDDLAPHADVVLPSVADLPAWISKNNA